MAKRLCGTPGCNQLDFHDGPCDGDEPISKRQRTLVVMPEPKRSNNSGSERGAGRSRSRIKTDALGLGTGAEVAPPRIPATQGTMPNGLQRFYHAHRWGVPLPPGQVEIDGGGSDEEDDDSWRLVEVACHTAARPEVAEADKILMSLWNAHVRSGPCLVSDRMLPEACRRFAQAHAETLRTDLRAAFRTHLRVLWEHNLLHRDDVQDCVNIAEEAGEMCDECVRPLHEGGCALAGRVRGAALWPRGGSAENTTTDGAASVTVQPGGLWEACA